jgi:hypothetical protein
VAPFFVVGYVGLSLPVVGAGVATLYVSFKTILLAFGAAVSIGVLLAAPLLLRRSTGITRVDDGLVSPSAAVVGM